MEKVYHMNTMSPSPCHIHTHRGTVVLMSDKGDSNANNIFSSKRAKFHDDKMSLLKEDIMILDLYAPNKAQNTSRKTKGKRHICKWVKGINCMITNEN